jgi:hypothetical protein
MRRAGGRSRWRAGVGHGGLRRSPQPLGPLFVFDGGPPPLKGVYPGGAGGSEITVTVDPTRVA